MIKEEKVYVPINTRNKNHFIKSGYDIVINTKFIMAYIKDLALGSKVKVTAICEICGCENIIQYSKYIINKNRNNKGYYSCFSCKNIEKEKTCLEKYGHKSYSMTSEFKVTESKKWKGIKKGHDKSKKTCLKKFGVDSYFKTEESRRYNKKWMSSDEFKLKSKKTLFAIYGTDSYSKTEEFKKRIHDNKEEIVRKIRAKFVEIYGMDWYSKTDISKQNFHKNKDIFISKIKETCMLRYNVDNVSKVESIRLKAKKTKEERGIIIPDELLDDWYLYKRIVNKLTNRVRKKLYENWDGFDYYDNELIKGYQSLSHIHRYYPTVDHKISVYYGFINCISPIEISSINNLCITKRFINSKKKEMCEEIFKIDF